MFEPCEVVNQFLPIEEFEESTTGQWDKREYLRLIFAGDEGQYRTVDIHNSLILEVAWLKLLENLSILPSIGSIYEIWYIASLALHLHMPQ